MRRLHLVIPLVAILAGCGSDSSAPPETGPDSPATAVEKFIAVAGTGSESAWEEACGLLSPGVRPGMRFSAHVTDSRQQCASALGLALYYAGDTGDLPRWDGFSGEVSDVDLAGNEAVVSVEMTYETEEGSSGPHETKVLAVNEDGGWWMATPHTLNLRFASEGIDEAGVRKLYEEALAASKEAESDFAAGEEASRAIEEFDPCPSEERSQATDKTGDVKNSNGMRPVENARAESDLTAVSHSVDGEAACFELEFAGEPPATGFVEVSIRPEEKSVDVRWEDDTAVGQTGLDDDVTAVAVDVTRGDAAMTFRIPAEQLTNAASEYRWAVELFVPNGQSADVDSVPDDVTVFRETDRYIPHPG